MLERAKSFIFRPKKKEPIELSESSHLRRTIDFKQLQTSNPNIYASLRISNANCSDIQQSARASFRRTTSPPQKSRTFSVEDLYANNNNPKASITGRDDDAIIRNNRQQTEKCYRKTVDVIPSHKPEKASRSKTIQIQNPNLAAKKAIESAHIVKKQRKNKNFNANATKSEDVETTSGGAQRNRGVENSTTKSEVLRERQLQKEQPTKKGKQRPSSEISLYNEVLDKLHTKRNSNRLSSGSNIYEEVPALQNDIYNEPINTLSNVRDKRNSGHEFRHLPNAAAELSDNASNTLPTNLRPLAERINASGTIDREQSLRLVYKYYAQTGEAPPKLPSTIRPAPKMGTRALLARTPRSSETDITRQETCRREVDFTRTTLDSTTTNSPPATDAHPREEEESEYVFVRNELRARRSLQDVKKKNEAQHVDRVQFFTKSKSFIYRPTRGLQKMLND